MMGTKLMKLATVLLAFAAAGALAQSKPATAPAAAPEHPLAAKTPEDMFKLIDKDGNKQLSLEEFKAAIEAQNKAMMIRRLQANYKNLDKNKNGFLEPTEYQAMPAVKSLGANAPTFISVDTNKDLRLDFREYVDVIGKLITATKAKK